MIIIGKCLHRQKIPATKGLFNQAKKSSQRTSLQELEAHKFDLETRCGFEKQGQLSRGINCPGRWWIPQLVVPPNLNCHCPNAGSRKWPQLPCLALPLVPTAAGVGRVWASGLAGEVVGMHIVGMFHRPGVRTRAEHLQQVTRGFNILICTKPLHKDSA